MRSICATRIELGVKNIATPNLSLNLCTLDFFVRIVAIKAIGKPIVHAVVKYQNGRKFHPVFQCVCIVANCLIAHLCSRLCSAVYPNLFNSHFVPCVKYWCFVGYNRNIQNHSKISGLSTLRLTCPLVKRSIIEHMIGLGDACPLDMSDSHVRETPS